MAKLCYSLLFIFLTFTASGQVTANAELGKTAIIIGDQVQLNLVVNHSPGIEIIGADLTALEALKEVEVLGTSNWDTIAQGGEFILEQRLTLTSFDSGYYYIPKIPVDYKGADGKLSKAFTPNKIPLTVNTVPIQSDSTTLAPIKPIIEEELNIRDFLPYIAGLLALALLIGGFYYYNKKKQEAEIPPPPEIILPAHEIAFNKLGALKKAKLWQQGHIKEYQSQLTYIVREYLENRFDINALESTTYEIMQEMKTSTMEEDWKEKLNTMLQTADLVKFAKAEPPVGIHDQMMEQAETFVRQTKQIEEETPETTDSIEEEIENEKI